MPLLETGFLVAVGISAAFQALDKAVEIKRVHNLSQNVHAPVVGLPDRPEHEYMPSVPKGDVLDVGVMVFAPGEFEAVQSCPSGCLSTLQTAEKRAHLFKDVLVAEGKTTVCGCCARQSENKPR